MTNFVSSMSQLDKVLHLYVEVRSLEEGKELHGGDHRSNLRMLHCPDVLPHLHRELVHTSPSHSPDFSPRTPHRSRALSQSLPLSRCSSRQTVNFQLPHQNDATFPTAAVSQNSLCGSDGQLSDLHTPGMSHSGLNGPYVHQSECASQQKWVPSSSVAGRWSVPSTPTSYRRLYDKQGADDENGTTSVVRYGFVEKASINTGSQQPPQNYYDKDNLFQKHINFQKRNSDPGWHYDPENYFLSHHRPVNKTHATPPQYRRGAFEAVAKDATHRALREFGSPELKRRYDSYSHENGSINLPQHQRPQQSWSSSPSPSPSPNMYRKGPTLSPRNSQNELAQRQGHTVVSVPHTPQHCPSSAASPSLTSRRPSPNLQPRLVVSQHTKSHTQPHLPAGKPTDIQHSISTNNIPPNQDYTNAFQTSSRNYPTENGHNSVIAKKVNKRHAAERVLSSPESDQPFVPLYYNLEKGSKCVADGRKYSQSDRVTMSSSPVPFIDPRVLHRANTSRQHFVCDSQPNTNHYWQKASHHLQPHNQTDIKNHGSPLTMGGHGSSLLPPNCFSSSKSLSLPSSLNHTDFSHCSELQLEHSPCFNNALKPEPKNHQYPCMERRPHHQVSARSVRSSPEVPRRSTLGPRHTSVNWTSRREVHSATKDQKYENKTCRARQEMKPVKKTHLDVYQTNTHSKVTQMEDHRKLGHAQTGHSTENCTSTKVGWKSSPQIQLPHRG